MEFIQICNIVIYNTISATLKFSVESVPIYRKDLVL